MVGLTLGTGLGAGIIANNYLYAGVNGGAGEFGSIPYREHNLEYYCSGQFFKNKYHLNGFDLYRKALQNDQQALAIYKEFGENVGNAIKIILFSIAPQAFILGGSISKAFKFFEEGLRESVSQFPFKRVTENLVIEPSKLQETALLGAAALFFDANQ